ECLWIDACSWGRAARRAALVFSAQQELRPPMFDTPEAQFAIEAVREASLLARRIQREMVSGPSTKDDRSPVPVPDFAVQALIARRLAELLPGSTLIGEENADALRLE